MKAKMLIALSICGLLLISGCTQSPKKDNGTDNDKDKSPPTNLTITLNEGHNFTKSRAVQLSVEAQDDKSVMEMAFSNNGVNWSAWESYSNIKQWNLTEGDGEKTVHFKAKDKAGNEGGPVNDTITLDTGLPTIKETTPMNTATGVALTQSVITITFSEKMNTEKLYGSPITMAAGTNPDENFKGCVWKTDKQLEFTLERNLKSNTTYTVKFHSGDQWVEDMAGNLVEKYSWSFTTRPGPKVLSYFPTGKDIDIKPTISITFDRPMDRNVTKNATKVTSVSQSGEAWVDFKTTWNGNTMTLQSLNYLSLSETYTVTVCGFISQCGGSYAVDAEGGHLEKTIKWTFTTRNAKIEVLTHFLHHEAGYTNTFLQCEFINNDPYNIINPYFKLEFFDGSSKLIATKELHYGADGVAIIMKPGEKMAFSEGVGDKDGLIKSVTITVSGDPLHIERATDQTLYDGVVVKNQTGHSTNCMYGGYCVEGTVKNKGNKDVDQVFVMGIFLGGNGAFVGVMGMKTNPKDVGMGQEATFGLLIFNETCDPSKIISYRLIVISGTPE